MILEESLEDNNSSPKPSRRISKEDTKPEDIRELTIKNLDTGEEFVIGENDPDFEFDTFPLSSTGKFYFSSLFVSFSFSSLFYYLFY